MLWPPFLVENVLYNFPICSCCSLPDGCCYGSKLGKKIKQLIMFLQMIAQVEMKSTDDTS